MSNKTTTLDKIEPGDIVRVKIIDDDEVTFEGTAEVNWIDDDGSIYLSNYLIASQEEVLEIVQQSYDIEIEVRSLKLKR